MKNRTLHLLHLAAAAAFLYLLAFTFDHQQAPVAFGIFLVAGGLAEIGFWVHLFKRS